MGANWLKAREVTKIGLQASKRAPDPETRVHSAEAQTS
jgi:hypothetical protein